MAEVNNAGRKDQSRFLMQVPKTIDFTGNSNSQSRRQYNPFERLQSTMTVDITEIYSNNSALLEEWFVKNSEEMKASVLMGKSFNEAVKETREMGKNFMEFEGFLINVNANSDKISLGDLTRARFMAIVHMYLFENSRADKTGVYHLSPLVMKVIFDQRSPLSSYRLLLGGGFQYLGKYISTNTAGRIDFFLGCALLDFLSAQSPKNEHHEACMRIGSFQRYIRSELLVKGGTFIAGARNMGQTNLDDFKVEENLKLFFDKANHIKFDMSKCGAQERLASSWQSILKTI